MNRGEIAAGLAPTPGYRYADRVGTRLYVSGQVPLDRVGAIVGVGDARVQCRQCLQNLFTLVAHHGFATRDIHHITVYGVGDRTLLGVLWEEVSAVFGGDVPPATLLGVTTLGYADQLVEIDALIDREEQFLG